MTVASKLIRTMLRKDLRMVVVNVIEVGNDDVHSEDRGSSHVEHLASFSKSVSPRLPSASNTT